MIGQSIFYRFCQALVPLLLCTPGVLYAQEVFVDSTPGEGSFTVPENVRQIHAEVWGAGGAGGRIGRGGGGGGAYDSGTLSVNSGDTLLYYVGGGAESESEVPGESSWFGSSDDIVAGGGNSARNSGTRQGESGGNRGLYSGGNGGAGSFFTGGGGGSSAGSAQDGDSASGSTGGTAPVEGGDGGAGGGTIFFFGGNGEPGEQPGGGGGGAGSGLFGGGSGGAGGDGQVRITYQPLALCSTIYDSPDGINENLPEDEHLDLSVFDPRIPEPWPGENVIPAGDHIYPGRTFPGNNIDYTVDGQARVLVDGNLTVDGNKFTMNAGGKASDLLLIVDGNLTFENNAEINAIVYVTGDINFGNNAVIVGALAAEGSIDIGGGQSQVSYDGSAVSEVDFGGACVPEEPSVVLDHLRIIHPDVGLTCRASDIQILACANSDCSSLYPEPVTVALDPAGWAPDNVSINGTSPPELTFQSSSEEVITLGIGSATPAPENGVECLSASGAASCVISFQEAGFVFDVPDLQAGDENSFSMAALETDERTQQCVALFANQTKDVNFHTTYLNPGPVDREAEYQTDINGTSVANNGTDWTPVSVTFDENGVAELTIQYNDVGRKGLSALFQESGQPDGGVLTITGNDNFVSVPWGLCLVPEKQCASENLNCTGTDATQTAGLSFDVLPKAYRFSDDVDALSCADKPTTPSFVLSGVPVNHQVVFPAMGWDGDLLEANLSYGVGEAPITLTEVGVFSMTTEGVTGGYLGRDVPESDAMTTPRMLPAEFNVAVSEPGELSPAKTCTGFTYFGQIFSLNSGLLPSLAVEALNAQSPPQTTRNYTHPDMIEQLGADRFRIAVPDSDKNAEWEDGSATPVPFRTEPDSEYLASGSVEEASAGVVRYILSPDDKFVYPKSVNSRIEPFLPDLAFVLGELSDKDGVEASDLPDDGLVIEPKPQGNFQIRYGRLSPQNVYGPENIEELNMPLYMEYWNGTRFLINTADSCTPWNTAEITSTAAHHSLVADSGSFSGGKAGPLVLEANDTEGTDTLTWETVDDWLKDDLDGDGTLDAPSALATFGVYRGHDRVIYWRER